MAAARLKEERQWLQREWEQAGGAADEFAREWPGMRAWILKRKALRAKQVRQQQAVSVRALWKL